MKTKFLTAALFILGLTTSAFSQQAKLEGHVYTHMNAPVPGARIIAPGGQAAVTSTRGHFRIAFPAPIQPGQATRIEVARAGWVIYEPMLGNCVTQSAARNYQPLKVIIVRKGSPLALSPKRLSQVIARWSNERNKLRGQVGELKSQLDEYAFLREYSEKYGFTLNQFVTAADQWAKSAESKDKYEQALKEYFLKNYDRAAILARESALIAKQELERANKQRNAVSLEFIKGFKLEGNALYEQNKYREAMASYGEIDRQFLTEQISKKALIEEWGEVKLLLGKAKAELGIRVEGKESKKLLSESVMEYQQALTVYTRETQPMEWALTQNNLGNTLSYQGERLNGEEGVQLLREAVEAYRQALTVRRRETLPQAWAMTQNNLGAALGSQGERLGGKESVQLLAEAVEAYRQALLIYTREALPQAWATTQNNLGLVLRSQGERVAGQEGVQLLSQAVEAHQQALTVRTREALPQDWAMTQNNLGAALGSQGERLGGKESVQLLAEAVEAYRQALLIYTREAASQDWAITQNNLGTALSTQGERVSGEEGVQLLSQAVEAYRQALTVRTRETLPQDWAATQNNLGVALTSQGERVSGEKGVRLLEQAVEAYRQALVVRTREHLPQDWAMTQNNLGAALYSQGVRASGEEGVGLLRQSQEAFEQALTVRTRETLPHNWAMTHKNLAEAFIQLKDWSNAAISLVNVLTIYPKDEEAYQKATYIYHEVVFNYPEAFRLNQKWLENNKGGLSAETDFAEKYFTTARFAECEQRIAKLLAQPDLEANTKIGLEVIEIANFLAMGKAKQVSVKIDSLIAAVSSQPADFQVMWLFDGTRHFVSQHEKLASHRAWLDQLFEAIGGSNREAILKSLQEVRVKFKE